jgi:type I restriction enzyme R subunit
VTLQSPDILQRFDAGVKAQLSHDISPLMQWVNIYRKTESWKFDRLVCRAQVELLRGSSKFDDLRDEIVVIISSLKINLTQVKVKLPFIEKAKSAEFWDEISVKALEQLRNELRGLVQFRNVEEYQRPEPKIIDVAEDREQIEQQRKKIELEKMTDLDMVAYRNRVSSVLQKYIDESETLRLIRKGQAVTSDALEQLCALILAQEPNLNLKELTDYYPHAKGLTEAIRGIVGMDAKAVDERFSEFVDAHPTMTSHQIKFLDLLQIHIAKYGSIEIQQLYEAPFTTLHAEGPDGMFDESVADELLDIIGTFRPQGTKE